MAKVTVYTTTYCGYCRMAKDLLKKKGIAYEEIDVTERDDLRDWLVKESGQMTVPQIFIGEESIGGYSDMASLDKRGELDKKLAAA